MPAIAVGTARIAAQAASLRVIAFCCAWPDHQLEMETIVSNWVKKTEAKTGNGHRLL